MLFRSTGLSQCTSFECPVSCIELGLVIYFTYGNMHVSMLFSQVIPPSPSPTESKSLFFICVSVIFSLPSKSAIVLASFNTLLYLRPESWYFVAASLSISLDFTYGNIHVSMLFSQIIPPSPSPTESKSLFFISVSLLLFRI